GFCSLLFVEWVEDIECKRDHALPHVFPANPIWSSNKQSWGDLWHLSLDVRLFCWKSSDFNTDR
ncbi:MAG: hypothetical protein WAU08_08225, partial [Flavobacteriales bacterium]